MIHQMMQQMNDQSNHVKISGIDLNQAKNMDKDDYKNPVPGECILREGKYMRAKDCKTLAWMYVHDKGYVQWARAHINNKSAPGMQKFRIYMFHRDRMQQMPVMNPRLQPRNVPKNMKMHHRDETGSVMSMEWPMQSQNAWEVMSETEDNENNVMNWQHMTQGLMALHKIKEEGLQFKFQSQVNPAKMASIMMKIIYQ